MGGFISSFAKALTLSAALAAMAGCSGTIPVNYAPQNFTRVNGQASVGKFAYSPADTGRVKPNQVQNTAVGQIYLPVNVADLVQRATALELEKSGIRLSDGSSTEVSGTVLELKADDLGYSVDWSYKVTYRISYKGTTRPIYEKTFTATPRKTGKFGLPSDYSSSINELLLSGYEQFIADPDSRRLLATSSWGSY